MTVETIYRIFFPWDEFNAQIKFETENPQYEKISEDTNGATYEYRNCYFVNLAERKEE